jgi:hypothetical protein
MLYTPRLAAGFLIWRLIIERDFGAEFGVITEFVEFEVTYCVLPLAQQDERSY